MDKVIDIKNLVEDQEYTIVLDTNVFMRLYDYSPEFSTFCLECLGKIKQYIMIPYTVKIEYYNNYHTGFKRRKNLMEKFDSKAIEEINKFESKIESCISELNKMQFPDINELKEEIKPRIAEIKNLFADYLEVHSDLKFVNSYLEENDTVLEFMEDLLEYEHVMESPKLEWIYKVCHDGKSRYKDSIPPGFGDAKNKDGIRKYSDLILWKETLEFALENERDIIFVTDDVKIDWWEKKDNGSIFHSRLIKEFEENTSKNIIALTSNDLFNSIANDFHITKNESIELVLNKTIDDYSHAISNSVFDSIIGELIYSGDTYISSTKDIDFTSDDLELLDVTDFTFVSAEVVSTNLNIIEYIFKYEVEINGESHDYWGKDPDNKEVINSPPNKYIFKGDIYVEVIREIGNFIDIMEDDEFDHAKIIDGNLIEIDYKPWGYFDELENKENCCPICTRPLTFEIDGLNGFCNVCDPDNN